MKPTLSNTNYLAGFETYLLAEKRVAQNTFLAYQKDIEQFIQFLQEEKVGLADVSKETFKKYLKVLKQQGLTARSVSRKISALKLLYSFLEERFQITNNAQYLASPKIEKTLPIYLTPEEVERLFKVANRDESPRGVRNKVMLSLLYASGVRISELLSLTVDNINFNTGFIQVSGKGNKERSIPLPGNVVSLLRHFLDTTYKEFFPPHKQPVPPYLFVSSVDGSQATPLSRQSLWGLIKKLIVKAQINKNISPHSLRHSLATHLLKNGADLRSLQLLLGHENLATVQIYTHVETSELRKIYDKKHPRA